MLQKNCSLPALPLATGAPRGRRVLQAGPNQLGTVINGVPPQETDWRKKCRLVPMTADRSLIARLAAHESWANTADPSARTAPARRAMLDRFERQVDPDGVLPPAERARRAGHARKACFARLALRSAQARRKTPAVEDGNGRAGRLDEAEPQ
jgi:hypothetical protein